MEIERAEVETDLEVSSKFPEFPELKRKLTTATSSQEAAKIIEQLQDMVIDAKDIKPEDKAALKQTIRENSQHYAAAQQSFVDAFSRSPHSYLNKVLDVFYIGEGKVTFGTDRSYMTMGLVTHNNRQNVLELILAGECYISGFPKVHFKSPKAYVVIQDPNVEGIFQVVQGNIEVKYESSTYGSVVRARAPQVTTVQGFVKQGDLYVPERFATGNWWEKKPSVDIAVRDGTITLQLKSPRLSQGKIFVPSSGYSSNFRDKSLEGILDDYLEKENPYHIKDIIRKKY